MKNQKLISGNVVKKKKKGDIIKVENALYLDTGNGVIPAYEQKVPGTNNNIQFSGKTYYYNSNRLNNPFTSSSIQEAIRQQDILHNFLNDLKSRTNSNTNKEDWQITYHRKSDNQPLSGIKEVVVKPKPKRFVTKKTRKEIDELVDSGKYKVVREGPYKYTGSHGKSTLSAKDLDKAIGAVIPFSNYHGVQPRPGEFIDAVFNEHNLGKSVQSGIENAAFFSGPIGRVARFSLGLQGLTDPDTGVTKTAREFSNGNYVGGTSSLIGDLLNLSLVRPGYTRLLRHPVKTTKKYNKLLEEFDDNTKFYDVFSKMSNALLGKEKPVKLRTPKEKLQIPFNIRSMFNYNLAKDFNQSYANLLNMLNQYAGNKPLTPQEVQEITNRWNLETKAEANGMTADEYKKFLKRQAKKVQQQQNQQQQTVPQQQTNETHSEEVNTPTNINEPTQVVGITPEDNLVVQTQEVTTPTNKVTTSVENIPNKNNPPVSTTTVETPSSVIASETPSSTVVPDSSTPTISEEDKKMMKDEILEYLKYNDIKGLNSSEDLDKLESWQLQDVYSQIQNIYRDYGMPHTKKEESSNTDPVNRSDVRDLLRYYGIDPYSLTAGQRKSLRKYINGDTSQDVSFLKELEYTRNTDNLLAPFTIYKNKVGGRLISRNPINRFKLK